MSLYLINILYLKLWEPTSSHFLFHNFSPKMFIFVYIFIHFFFLQLSPPISSRWQTDWLVCWPAPVGFLSFMNPFRFNFLLHGGVDSCKRKKRIRRKAAASLLKKVSQRPESIDRASSLGEKPGLGDGPPGGIPPFPGKLGCFGVAARSFKAEIPQLAS